MFLKFGYDQLDIGTDNFRCGSILEVVGADEQHDCRRIERKHVLCQSYQNPTRGVATDTAIGDLHAGKGRPVRRPNPG